MKPLQVYLDEDVIKKLKLEAIEQGTSMSDLVRDSLEGIVSVDATKGTAVATIKPTNARWSPKVKSFTEKVDEPLITIPKIPGVTRGVHLCKNGHISNEYGKCLDKECKYAK